MSQARPAVSFKGLLLVLALSALAIAGCGPAQPADSGLSGVAVEPAAPTAGSGDIASATAAVPAEPTALPTLAASATPQATETPIPPPPSPTAVPTTGPTPTPTVTWTPSPTFTPSPSPTPITINGMSADRFIVMPPEVLARSREIFARGRELGRDPRRFSKLGDSLVLTSHYLVKFDTGLYNLGPDYAFLQPVIDHYSGSFERYGVAVRVGLHAWSVFDPLWADKDWCEPNEDMLACEIRLHNPSVMLIRLGSNDIGPPGSFEFALREVIEATIAAGVLPVLGTKADRFEGDDNRNNIAIRKLAEEYRLPLWDFDRIADTLPYRGVSEDNVHLTILFEHDYTDPDAFARGYPVNDLTALVLLHRLINEVMPVVE